MQQLEKHNQEEMTAIEAVEATRNLLGDIMLPAKYKDSIAVIHAAMDNLTVIIKMIEKEQKENGHEDDCDEQGENVPG